MPDVYTAAKMIAAGKEPPESVYIPCGMSASYRDGTFPGNGVRAKGGKAVKTAPPYVVKRKQMLCVTRVNKVAMLEQSCKHSIKPLDFQQHRLVLVGSRILGHCIERLLRSGVSYGTEWLSFIMYSNELAIPCTVS